MLAPKIIPRLATNDIIPALTNPTVITVVAEEDWISAVIPAPVNKELNLFFVNLAINFLKVFPDALWISLEKFSIPYKKIISPVATDKRIVHGIIECL